MMSSDQPAIKITGLQKTFHTGLRRKKTHALRGLDLEVAAGEIFGFLGPNGAGKTTAIKILVGLLRADAGQAHVFGRSVKDEKARRRIAYLPELPDFYDYLNPVEFLHHCGRLSGIEKEKIRKRVPDLLGQVGLDPDERRPLRKFSKGMLQRVGIAQAMLTDPDLYILDEPMGGLDPIGRRWMKNLIRQLGQRGKTIFFSSHVLAEAEAVCDRVAFLQAGRMVAQGGLSDLIREQAGKYEVVVAGEEVRQNEQIGELATEMQPAGEDTRFFLAGDVPPEKLLEAILSGGFRVVSASRHHASLEEAFIRALGKDTSGEGA